MSSSSPTRAAACANACCSTRCSSEVRACLRLYSTLLKALLNAMLTLLTLLYSVHSTYSTQGALFLYEHALPALCRALLGIELRGDWRCA